MPRAPRTPRLPSPAFEWDPVPQPCVLLLLETEQSYFRPRRPVLCQTELRPFARWARDRAHPYRAGRGSTPLRATSSPRPQATPDPSHSRQATPGPSRSRQATPGLSRSRHTTPGPSQPRSVRFPSQPPASDDEGGGRGDGHEITKLPAPGADGLIPKPNGEVGHKTRGYSLPDILDWDPTTYKAVRERVKLEVSKYLDHALSTSNQLPGAVEKLTKLIVSLIDANFPVVSEFRDAWPIADMIHLRLKYTSSRRGTKSVPQAKGFRKSALRKAMRKLTRGETVERPETTEWEGQVDEIQPEQTGGRILMGVRHGKEGSGKHARAADEETRDETSSKSDEDND